ncbi:MAG: hypothetical protein WAU07_05560 [Microgenomates group bacterium]
MNKSEFVTLAIIGVVMTGVLMTSRFISQGGSTVSDVSAKQKTKEVIGEGATEHLSFSVNVFEYISSKRTQATANAGSITAKALSPDADITNLNVRVDTVQWSGTTAFVEGPVVIRYSTATTSANLRAKILLVDQDQNNPDPNPYFDIFSVQLCDGDNCETPWMPWVVEEGNIEIK